VAVSTVGILARGAHLIVILMVGRAFGPAVLGHFLLGLGLFEIAAAIVVTGLTDGTTLMVSRRAILGGPTSAGEPGPPLANVVATALRVGGGAALLLAIATTVLASTVASHPSGPYADVWPGAVFLAWALVPSLVARVAFAATTGFLRLEWEAIAGAAGPALGLLMALPLAHAAGGGVRGLFAAMLAAQVGTAVAAMVILQRHLRLGLVWRAMLRARLDRGLLKFALPQALNMAATTYITRMDILMLAAFGLPAGVVGVYGTVAALALELRQARVVVTGVLGALVAREHAAGGRGAVSEMLSRAAGWAASIAVPLTLGFIVVRRDVVTVLAPGYHGETGFVLVLLVGPLVNCMGGLAGNFLVYLLHNRWNLANSLAVAGVNTALCWLVIPRFGIMGAAACGTVSLALLTVLENLELSLLEGLHIAPQVLAPAILTLALGTALVWSWDAVSASVRWQVRLEMGLGVALAAALFIRGGARGLGPDGIGQPR
jgi:O-antigen/teichoic acid export membrane protein